MKHINIKLYLVDPATRRIDGHDASNAHGALKHINVKLLNGDKVAMNIMPRGTN